MDTLPRSLPHCPSETQPLVGKTQPARAVPRTMTTRLANLYSVAADALLSGGGRQEDPAYPTPLEGTRRQSLGLGEHGREGGGGGEGRVRAFRKRCVCLLAKTRLHLVGTLRE